MEKKIRLGLIGLGGRCRGLYRGEIKWFSDVEVTAVCDVYDDRVKSMQDIVGKYGAKPIGYTDYRELVTSENVDAVLICCNWEKHVEVAVAAMRAGKITAMEVGGARTVEECWELVDCYEQTHTPFMFLENCCYGKYELAVLNMVRLGLFGEVVHCEGGYRHDLRGEISGGEVNRHYRLKHYLEENCENYPTHEIGPIATVLNLNYGNRMVYLTSTASKACGLRDYIAARKEKNEHLKKLENLEFKQGDVVTTVIKCANGETITIFLDTTLPRPYSRAFSVHGTKALYREDGGFFCFDNNPKHKRMEFSQRLFWKNAKRFERKYRHPIWQANKFSALRGGHGGMDHLVLRAFFDAIKKGDGNMPIDVYDAASWMVITALSEESIKNGSQAIEFPDFTRGRWKERKPQGDGIFFIK